MTYIQLINRGIRWSL